MTQTQHAVLMKDTTQSATTMVRRCPHPLVRQICDIHQQLIDEPSLRPSCRVNALFTKLVDLCSAHHDPPTIHAVLKDPAIRAILYSLQDLCSTGEFLLEWAWCVQLLRDTHNGAPGIVRNDAWRQKVLSKFTYYDNYKDLVCLEFHALQGIGARLEQIAFVGSGPLPLSSILLYLKGRGSIRRIDNVDRDRMAVRVSSELIAGLEIQEGLHCHSMEAQDYPGYATSDVIVIGALVGGQEETKLQLVQQIACQARPGTIFLLRSAHSLRQLLYPVITPQQLRNYGLEIILEIHPHNAVVNSVLLARRV